ncbi:MAG: murein biosynthesis integral membrane protein MurJ [Caldisericum sp.]
MDKRRILRSQTIKEAAIITAIVSLLSKIVGYVRDMLTAKYFGTSPQMDAFEVALIIPNMILGIFAAGMQTIIVRMYTEKKGQGNDKGKIFVSQLFFIYSVILFFITLLLVIFSPVFVKIVASGLTSDRFAYASAFVKMLAVFGFLNIMTGFFTGVFQAEKQFLYPAVAGLVANFVIPITLLLLAPKIGIYSRVLGQDLFGLVYFFLLFSFLYFRWKFFRQYDVKEIDWAGFKEFTNLMIPAMVVSGMSVLYQIVDKTVASYLPYGAIASLSYAQTVYLIPYSLIGVSLTTAVYPTLSSHVVSKNNEEYERLFKKAFYVLVFIMIPFTVYFSVWARPIVRVLFERGAFNESSALLTTSNVLMYSLGLLGITLADLFRRAFFTYKDTKTPMFISWVSVALNLVLDIVLAKIMGAPGIALATTIVTYISLLQYILYSINRRYFDSKYLRNLLLELFKAFFVGALMAILAYLSLRFIPIKAHALTVFLRSIGLGIILFIIYVGIGKLVRSEIFDIAFSYAFGFLKTTLKRFRR